MLHVWSIGAPVQVVNRGQNNIGWDLRFSVCFHCSTDAWILVNCKTSTRASYLARNLYFRTRIESKFSLPNRATARVTREGEYSSPAFQEKFPTQYGVGCPVRRWFQPVQDSSSGSTSTISAVCAAGGRYVLMEKIGGAWRTGCEHYTWILET